MTAHEKVVQAVREALVPEIAEAVSTAISTAPRPIGHEVREACALQFLRIQTEHTGLVERLEGVSTAQHDLALLIREIQTDRRHDRDELDDTKAVAENGSRSLSELDAKVQTKFERVHALIGKWTIRTAATSVLASVLTTLVIVILGWIVASKVGAGP
jgi:hypothetical protein